MSTHRDQERHRPDLPPVYVEGLAVWAPCWPSWSQAQAAFRGKEVAVDPPAKRPAPLLLPPTERRRAPDTVALAMEVASQAIDGSGHAAADLPCVFTSAHGDLAINDNMCSTLAESPTLLSPTKFHNSVHNAAAGYWTMGTSCMQTSTAVSAFEHSFAAGLLEALSFCVAEQRPVLLVGYDTQACGALSTVTKSHGLLAVALVLAPQRSAHTRTALHWALGPSFSKRTPLRSAAAQSLSDNAMADALPLFEALAQPVRATEVPTVDLPLSSHTGLRIHLQP